MNEPLPPIRLSCSACGYSEDCTLSDAVRYLRRANLLKATSDSSPEVVRELLLASAAKIVCPDCDYVGMSAKVVAPLDAEAWGQARSCEGCRQPIPRERLELLPEARLCASCQAKSDRGELDSDREFCPRCGSVMQVVADGRRGITRYALRCPACRR